ncbi:DUF1223 domain-containing protein [Rhizobium sp. RU20A]|uniref:DUF1223 domain-containing protein n=1 Tax=Rhizobium sp. RU20A TaxID=1907412 RepID=UPI001FCE935A|nr:DUF1223 domain-containing protein [Rhizobium sp. RU20A]
MAAGAQAAGHVLSNPKAVVELFTSQGCSSCPPADEVMKSLIRQGDVVALAYHVDYWNYLGWNDTLATKDNTARQYAYSKALGRAGVYTPQAIVNGEDHANGRDLGGIRAKIEDLSRAGRGLTVPVNLSMNGQEIDIAIGAGPADRKGTPHANVVVVYFDVAERVKVEKGENSGRDITYAHPVRDVQTIGMWDGSAKNFVLPRSVIEAADRNGCAILLQATTPDGAPGRILGAASIVLGEAIHAAQ